MRRLHILIGSGLILLGLAGCTTMPQTAYDESRNLFSAPEAAASTTPPYGPEQVERDFDTLISLTRELDALSDEMVAIRRTFTFKDTPYLSDLENKQIELLLFRFLNARESLWDMMTFYREGQSPDPEIHTRGSVLAMCAGLRLTYYSSRFAALFLREPELIALINSAHPRYEIPAGMYDTITDSVTSIDHLELLDVAWYFFGKALADPASDFSTLRADDPAYRDLIDGLDALHADTHIQTEYILQDDISPLPEIRNRLHHSQIAKLADQWGEDIGSGMYTVQGFIFRDVARIKNPGSRLLQFSDDQVRDIKKRLQPGDLLFTYSAGYMSNVFLPGTFKHGITYIGSPEARRRAGLTDAFLSQRAVSEEQAAKLIARVNQTRTPEGQDADVIEAVAEGVVMHSLEELLATHINRLVVIRPTFTEAERAEQLLALFQYLGAAYDFKFDFQDDRFQCCTELIYRTTNNLGSIDYSLVKMKGLWILAADDMLRYALGQQPDAFEFVLLAQQGDDADDLSAVIHTGDPGLETLRQVMSIAP